MTEDVLTEIGLILGLLRKTLTRNGVSIGVNKINGDIIFFDAAEYYRDKENFKQFTVKLKDLVQ